MPGSPRSTHYLPPFLEANTTPFGTLGLSPALLNSLSKLGYTVPNLLVEYAMRNTHVPPGPWRAVAHTNNPFARECFVDEIAHARAVIQRAMA